MNSTESIIDCGVGVALKLVEVPKHWAQSCGNVHWF